MCLPVRKPIHRRAQNHPLLCATHLPATAHPRALTRVLQRRPRTAPSTHPSAIPDTVSARIHSSGGASHDPSSFALAPALWLVYLLVVAALLLRLFYGLGTALRIWRGASPVSVDADSPLAAGLHLRASRAVSSPVTIGSAVVLPADYATWDSEKLRIVLAHERSHIRQGDFYLQLLTALYAALFWFSPLGWWLKRKLSDLAEAISDRAGLEQAASRSAYAQILLEFAAAPRPTFIGVAMARTGSLSRRIERLLNDNPSARHLRAIASAPCWPFCSCLSHSSLPRPSFVLKPRRKRRKHLRRKPCLPRPHCPLMPPNLRSPLNLSRARRILIRFPTRLPLLLRTRAPTRPPPLPKLPAVPPLPSADIVAPLPPSRPWRPIMRHPGRIRSQIAASRHSSRYHPTGIAAASSSHRAIQDAQGNASVLPLLQQWGFLRHRHRR